MNLKNKRICILMSDKANFRPKLEKTAKVTLY
jgi:hypothetical protein